MLRLVGGLDVVCEQDRKVDHEASFDLGIGKNGKVVFILIETEKWVLVLTFERINQERSISYGVGASQRALWCALAWHPGLRSDRSMRLISSVCGGGEGGGLNPLLR